MGLLDQLWDDTVAGPRPETGLGRLRKHSSFGLRSNSTIKAEGAAAIGGGCDRGWTTPSPGNATPRCSPACSTPPVSPFSGSRDSNRLRRKSLSDAYERDVGGGGEGMAGVGYRDAPPHEI
ncbi:hypothetical protein OPV22_029054 [Ensete ventricosum]|uniref:Uncharacterized protein n=1 Tax=Ensete ventricosum TaxID=4639 RepID=A0AAV8P4N7_ENSVE|nr:hypothetical protein OPV22_029054 [Ensete ventricosum]